jgi:hypothetical protein
MLQARHGEHPSLWSGVKTVDAMLPPGPVVVGPTRPVLPRHGPVPVPRLGPVRVTGLLRVDSVRRAPEYALRGKPRDV